MKSLALAVLHVERSPETLPLGAGCVRAALLAAPGLEGRLKTFIVEDEVGVDAVSFADSILAAKADYVGFSLFSWNRTKTIEVCAVLRKRDPGLVIFAGGPEASADAGRLDAEGVFDFIVAGEGEDATVAAMTVLLSGSGLPPRILRGRPVDPTTSISPWLSGALNPRAYGGGVLWELTRGCPFSCAYCFEGKGEKGVRHFPLPRLEAELDLFSRSGVTQVFVLDPTFNISRARTVELLRIFRRKAPGIHWKFEIRAELLDREQASLFGSLDCSVQIGLQSAHKAVLATVNRSIDRTDFRRKLALLDAASVPFGLDLIYGLPGDSLAGFRESLDFALSLAPNHLDIFPLAVLPGTELADRKEEYGLETEDRAPHLVISSPLFPRGDMEAAASLASACDFFYSRGRAVAWFGQIRAAAGLTPSVLIQAFGEFLNMEGISRASTVSHREIEEFQITFLSILFRRRKKEKLMDAITDLVRFNGAWSRAIAEKDASEFVLHYDPDLVLGPAALNLTRFVAETAPRRTAVRVSPGPRGPELFPLRGDPGISGRRRSDQSRSGSRR